MTHMIDAIAADLLSGLIRACEDMAVPAGSPPVGDAVPSAALIMQVGLPAPGELIPLATAAIVFIVAAALILLRAQTPTGSSHSAISTNILPAHSA